MRFEMLFLAGGMGSRVRNVCDEQGVEFKSRLKIPNQNRTFLEAMLENRFNEIDSKILVPKGRSNEFSDIEGVVEQELPNFTRGSGFQKARSYLSTQLGHTLTGYQMNEGNTHLIVLPTDLYLPDLNIDDYLEAYENKDEAGLGLGALLIGDRSISYRTHALDMARKVAKKEFFDPAIYIIPKEKIERFPLNTLWTPILLHSQDSEVIDGGDPKTFQN